MWGSNLVHNTLATISITIQTPPRTDCVLNSTLFPLPQTHTRRLLLLLGEDCLPYMCFTEQNKWSGAHRYSRIAVHTTRVRYSISVVWKQVSSHSFGARNRINNQKNIQRGGTLYLFNHHHLWSSSPDKVDWPR